MWSKKLEKSVLPKNNTGNSNLEKLIMVSGRFANESFRQRLVRQRLRSIRERAKSLRQRTTGQFANV